MANHENKPVSLEEAIRASEANIKQMEEDLGLLDALEQERRAAALRLEIATAYERHRALVHCHEFGCETADQCMCGAACPCGSGS